MRKTAVISILIIFAFAINCFAGQEVEGIAEGIIPIEIADGIAPSGGAEVESEPKGFHISGDSYRVISLYDSTTRLYVDYGDQYIPDDYFYNNDENILKVYFISDNEEILKVTEDGRIIPLKAGSTKVTAAVRNPAGGWLSHSIDVTVLDIEIQTGDSLIGVLPGETAIISVHANSRSGRMLQYNWSLIDPETNENIWMTNTLQGFLIIENVTEPITVCCWVSDGTYPGAIKVYYYIQLINLDMAYAGGDANYWGDIYADQDGNATLIVNVVARNPENLTYTWEDASWNWMGREYNSNVMEVTGITAAEQYNCWVMDEFGNGTYVFFDVYPYDQSVSEPEDGIILLWEDPIVRLE